MGSAASITALPERVTKDDAKKAAREAGVEWTDAWDSKYDSIAKGQADGLVSRIDEEES